MEEGDERRPIDPISDIDITRINNHLREKKVRALSDDELKL